MAQEYKINKQDALNVYKHLMKMQFDLFTSSWVSKERLEAFEATAEEFRVKSEITIEEALEIKKEYFNLF